MADNLPLRSIRPPALTRPKLPAAPRHLSPSSRRLWRDIVRTWQLDAPGRDLWLRGLETRDRYLAAAAEVARDGVTIAIEIGGKNPRTERRAHPALKIANDALAAYRAVLRQLNLEVPE